MKKETNQQPQEHENVQRLTIWLAPSKIHRMDGWLESDNCKNRSEFIDRALGFYMGYLGSEDTSAYLSETLVATLQGIVRDNNNRMRSLIFKWAMELGIMSHTIAAHFRDPLENRRVLRGYVVNEVKRTNGQIKFEDAQDIQRQLSLDDERED